MYRQLPSPSFSRKFPKFYPRILQVAHKLVQPADKTLKTMAVEFAEYQVCVDLFITTQSDSYIDIASVSVIPRTTGGQFYYYYPFSTVSDSQSSTTIKVLRR
ncbi:protein transport protein Sec24-like At4g32640 [Malus sylvestris]|uniref:protein transport protein SEC24 C-like n=1 Tax=Malus domestica TaxID=3750 RepID=UPI0010AB4C71|nr:protein transport protein Sec24-like At4g32640 [Malus domestica]XP_050149473.1 protein transport protein Sec24-like At4g32640 [Malus sylvestris]